MALRLQFLYTHDNSMGYGRMGTQLHRAFTARGIEVTDHLRIADDPAPVALWANLPMGVQGWYDGQHRALLTMWEATELPETLRDSLHNVDQVFVPSVQNCELYGQYHRHVTYVPLGVDPDAWHYRERQVPGRMFWFLADGRGVRKGTDVAVKAFRAAFPYRRRLSPEPRLMLKGSSPARYGNDVVVVGSRQTDDEEVETYAAAHCFLAPSRGEGWGLQPLQAIAQGCPTILTDAHGQRAFASLGYPVSATLSRALEYRLYGRAGEWWEPDLDELVEHMRFVYDHYDKALKQARWSSAMATSVFTWAKSADRLLGNLSGDLGASVAKGLWRRPTQRLYPVAVRLFHRCEIGGEVYCFYPGKVYHERAELKRNLFENGILDPACLALDGTDNGLLPEQCKRIGAVSAAHEACPTCGQQLNTKPLWEYEEAESVLA